jgi:hypothetical protein
MKHRLDLFAGLFMGLLLAAPVFLHAAGVLAESESHAIERSSQEHIAAPATETGETKVRSGADGAPLLDQ